MKLIMNVVNMPAVSGGRLRVGKAMIAVMRLVRRANPAVAVYVLSHFWPA